MSEHVRDKMADEPPMRAREYADFKDNQRRMAELSRDITSTQERRFTRAEVLKWLKDRKALIESVGAPVPVSNLLAALSHEFERME